MNDPHQKALERIVGDMDEMESGKMFGAPEKSNKGVDITISVVPNTGEEEVEGIEGADHPLEMCEGGCAYHKGGMVDDGEDVDMKMPPWMRKKKKSSEM